MTVHIGELSTQVTTEAPPGRDPAPAAASPAPWTELERARRAQAELERMRARTAAEGFHD